MSISTTRRHTHTQNFARILYIQKTKNHTQSFMSLGKYLRVELRKNQKPKKKKGVIYIENTCRKPVFLTEIVQ